MIVKFKPRTIAVYRAIEAAFQSIGVPPTLRELARSCRIAHTSCIRHLDKLEAGGYIERWPGKSRGIRILKPLKETHRGTK